MLEAVFAGKTNVVRLLLERGADPDVKGRKGTPAVDLADNDEIKSLLREYSARRAQKRALEARQEQPGPSAEGLSKEEMRKMMTEAAEKAAEKAVAAQAAKGGKQDPEGAAPYSDVDEPRYRLAQNPDDFALVVGIENYVNELPAAQFAERDAWAVKAHLIAMGYPERNIKYLTGGRATRGSLDAVLEDWLPRNVKPASRVFFYFSGHGAPDPTSGQAYLVPSDGDPNSLSKTALPLKKVYASLRALKAKSVVVALDSCFSGGGGRSVLAEGARPLVTQVDTALGARDGIVLLAAALPKEITSTLKEQGHGIFTYHFLKGLGGGAQDKSGVVTPQGLYQYLKPKVQDAASRQSRDQTPVLEGAASLELVRFK